MTEISKGCKEIWRKMRRTNIHIIIEETRSKEGEKQVLIDEKIKAMIPAEVTSPAMRTLIGLMSRFSTS